MGLNMRVSQNVGVVDDSNVPNNIVTPVELMKNEK